MYFLSLKTSLNNHHLKLYVMLNQSLILNALKISKFRSKSKVAAHNAWFSTAICVQCSIFCPTLRDAVEKWDKLCELFLRHCWFNQNVCIIYLYLNSWMFSANAWGCTLSWDFYICTYANSLPNKIFKLVSL